MYPKINYIKIPICTEKPPIKILKIYWNYNKNVNSCYFWVKN